MRGNDDKKSNATLLVCALLVLTLAACGKKGPPQPPPGVPNTYPQTYPQQ
ncbi:MAG TPA: lipoprotein [Stellaceae bacterium]|nr:lipoprotein [Stellaceae bacterium]